MQQSEHTQYLSIKFTTLLERGSGPLRNKLLQEEDLSRVSQQASTTTIQYHLKQEYLTYPDDVRRNLQLS